MLLSSRVLVSFGVASVLAGVSPSPAQSVAGDAKADSAIDSAARRAASEQCFRDVIDLVDQTSLTGDQIKALKGSQAKVAEQVRAFVDNHAGTFNNVTEKQAEELLKQLPDPNAALEAALNQLPPEQRELVRKAMRDGTSKSQRQSSSKSSRDGNHSSDSSSSHSSQSSKQSSSSKDSSSSHSSKSDSQSKKDHRTDSGKDAKTDAKHDSKASKQSEGAKETTSASAKQRLRDRLATVLREVDKVDRDRLEKLLDDKTQGTKNR